MAPSAPVTPPTDPAEVLLCVLVLRPFSPHLPQVEHRLMDMLPLIKRRRVSGQMEGLTVAEREREHQVCFKEDMLCVNG